VEQGRSIPVQPVAPAAYIQLGVLVNDGSGSMTLTYADPEGAQRTKAAAVDLAVRGLVERLQASRMASNFCLSVVAFNDNVTDLKEARRVAEIPVTESYDPTDHGIGGTAIHRGLDAAYQIISEFLNEGRAAEVPTSAVVVLMSDGEERDDPEKTRAAAARLKELPNTSLAACLFATDGQQAEGEPLLKEIVSEPRFYKRVHGKDELREFFLSSVTSGRAALPPGAE
jgi:uncharacterized protein YegL